MTHDINRLQRPGGMLGKQYLQVSFVSENRLNHAVMQHGFDCQRILISKTVAVGKAHMEYGCPLNTTDTIQNTVMYNIGSLARPGGNRAGARCHVILKLIQHADNPRLAVVQERAKRCAF